LSTRVSLFPFYVVEHTTWGIVDFSYYVVL